MDIRICIDVGGTFTDVVVANETGYVNVFKSFTTHSDRVQGVINGLNVAADFYGVSLEKIMQQCSFISHGTTTATNVLIERKTAKVGLICTKGHRDILTFREGAKEDPFDWYLDYPEPYVPRYLTFGVTERITAEGDIHIPLDEDEVRDAIRTLKGFNVQAIAVALIWSISNPVHEKRIATIIEEEWPDVLYSLSHVVNPSIREYRRTVCTAIDASLKPIVNKYISYFEKNIRDIGYTKRPYLLSASGGMATPEEMAKKPLYMLDSGPSLAPVSGAFYVENELQEKNVITCDMGGTSFDVSRITDGLIAISRDVKIADEKLNIAKVDTKSIGAGGGSIAWVDNGGLLHVGPKGAGSEPGPACYCRGGTEPTVTDANVILGYLDPDYFLGGTIKLDKGLAEKAIYEKISKPLNISLLEGAFAIWNTVCTNMTEAIRDITVWEGIDPREYVFISGGGAGGIHIVSIIDGLEGKKIIIPKTAAGMSAFGGLIADIVKEYQWSYFTPTNKFDYDGVNDVLSQLENDARKFLTSAEVPPERQRIEFFVEARYPFQEKEITIQLNRNKFNSIKDVEELEKDFHILHDKTLGSKDPSQYVECVVWRARAVGLIPPIKLKKKKTGTKKPPSSSIKGERGAYFRELNGIHITPVYEGDELLAGNIILGPAIIEEKTTTIVITPKSKVLVSDFGNYIIDL